MNITRLKHEIYSFCFLLWIITLNGCGPAFQSGGDVAQGRQALFSRNYPAAVGYFQTAVKTDPSYVYTNTLQEGIYSYLGRAQYLTRDYAQARQSLEKDIAQHPPGTPLSQLYLGLTLARSGDRPGGLKNIQAGTKGIADFLNNIGNYAPPDMSGYWDPGRSIRNAADNNLKMIAAGNFNWNTLIANSEILASNFEQEPDRADLQREREFQDNMGR